MTAQGFGSIKPRPFKKAEKVKKEDLDLKKELLAYLEKLSKSGVVLKHDDVYMTEKEWDAAIKKHGGKN